MKSLLIRSWALSAEHIELGMALYHMGVMDVYIGAGYANYDTLCLYK